MSNLLTRYVRDMSSQNEDVLDSTDSQFKNDKWKVGLPVAVGLVVLIAISTLFAVLYIIFRLLAVPAY